MTSNEATAMTRSGGSVAGRRPSADADGRRCDDDDDRSRKHARGETDRYTGAKVTLNKCAYGKCRSVDASDDEDADVLPPQSHISSVIDGGCGCEHSVVGVVAALLPSKSDL